MRQDTITRLEQEEFFNEHLSLAEEVQQEYRAVDEEVLQNYMVEVYNDNEEDWDYYGTPQLKDTETFQFIETLLAKMLLMTLGDDGFATAQPQGTEDAFKARTVSRLVERGWVPRGNFRATYDWFKSGLLRGVGIISPGWAFEEGFRNQRFTGIDPFTGEEFSETVLASKVLKDDLSLTHHDVDDFFYTENVPIEKMQFAAVRSIVPEFIARERAAEGRWNKSATERALHNAMDVTDMDKEWRADVESDERMLRTYKPVVLYEGYGVLPFKPRDGIRHRRLTMVNGVLVESRPNPYGIDRNIPIYELPFNPVSGRFRGVAPGAVARFTQSFTDALLICLAHAIMRKTTSPVIYDTNAQINPQELERWRGPIGAIDVNAIKEINYNPPLAEAFALLSGLKTQMRESSSALDILQGVTPSTQPRSATESALRSEAGMDRVTLAVRLIEEEYLPALSQGMFQLNQQFIRDSADLQRRIGSPEFSDRLPLLDDIDGDFDIRFVGSKRVGDKRVRLELLEKGMQIAASVPGAAPLYPWGQAFVEFLRLSDQRTLEALVGNPEAGMQFMARQQMLSGGQNPGAGNGNFASRQTQPSGLNPAQATGRAL